MKIAVLSMWHNEEFLAPFFLNHYDFADSIHLVIGKDTLDQSREIASRAPNVTIEDFTFPGGLLNDTIKIHKFNEMLRASDADWTIAVDADEFIWPLTFEQPATILERQEGNLLYAKMWQVYRNYMEGFLDPTRPPFDQRRHGNPKWHHIKPIIVRRDAQIAWDTGHHNYIKPAPWVRESDEFFVGAHWAMADEDMAIRRYIAGRQKRMSQENLDKRHGFHTFDLTPEGIREECRRHLHDPRLF
jgi:hypothetical protein